MMFVKRSLSVLYLPFTVVACLMMLGPFHGLFSLYSGEKWS